MKDNKGRQGMKQRKIRDWLKLSFGHGYRDCSVAGWWGCGGCGTSSPAVRRWGGKRGVGGLWPTLGCSDVSYFCDIFFSMLSVFLLPSFLPLPFFYFGVDVAGLGIGFYVVRCFLSDILGDVLCVGVCTVRKFWLRHIWSNLWLLENSGMILRVWFKVSGVAQRSRW